MKKIMKYIKKIFKTLFVIFYMVIVSFWIITGFAVNRIIQNHSYIQEQYAQTVIVEDVTYFYRQAGNPENPTILFIHGFLGSSYDFIHVFEDLKDEYHVIAVDLIGFGLSEKSVSFTYSKQNQADYLAQFLFTLNIEEVTIIAHSMGGEISIHLAHDYPDMVKQMILIGSGGYYINQGGGLVPRSLPAFFYDHVVNNYYIQRAFFFTAYSQPEVDAGLITYDDFDEMFYVNRTIPGTVMKKFTEDNDSGATNSKLASIQQNTLLIWGDLDGFIPLSTGQLLLEALGNNASLIVMEQAGHLPFDTYFDPFMNHVREFLNR
jgi:pimeloyl-ACP methyl ester carboxylesterase